MSRKDECSQCHSKNQTEIITGRITIKVFREGDFVVKDEITYDKTDKNSKLECSDCRAEWV
ncbi:MAG: hypothetical protein AABX33_07245 [Nanoarchaeota archaeon]